MFSFISRLTFSVLVMILAASATQNSNCVARATTNYATCATRQSSSQPATAQKPLMPLDKIIAYLENRYWHTSLQKNRSEKELVGNTFEGDISVWDVSEQNETVIIKSNVPGQNAELWFLLTDSKLKDKASTLLPGNRLRVVAKLARFWNSESRYTGEHDTYIAEFSKNISFEPIPAKDK